VRNRWADKFQAVSADGIPWTALSKPLSQCKVALVTTGGVHLKTDNPFDMFDTRGDPSYRQISSSVSPAELMITHDYYDHRDADEDINLVFPIEILRQCQREGLLGATADFFYGFMGHIEEPHVDTLINRTAKEVALQLKQQQADVVILVPA
jgi:D-proline reductase (dithiol) PrdB